MAVVISKRIKIIECDFTHWLCNRHCCSTSQCLDLSLYIKIPQFSCSPSLLPAYACSRLGWIMYPHKLPVWSPVWQPIKILRYRCCRRSASLSWHIIWMCFLICMCVWVWKWGIHYIYVTRAGIFKQVQYLKSSFKACRCSCARRSVSAYILQPNTLNWLTALCDRLVWTYAHCHWITYMCYILLA